MFKIIPQDNKLFTVKCYFHSTAQNKNVEIWSVTNLDEQGVSKLLGENHDTDFAFAVVKSSAGPVLLTTKGEVLPKSIKPKALSARWH
jgi:hypothetical protein